MEAKVEIKTVQFYYVTVGNILYRREIHGTKWHCYHQSLDFWRYFGEMPSLDEIVQNSGVMNHTITGTQE